MIKVAINSGDTKLIKRKQSKMILNDINELNTCSNVDSNRDNIISDTGIIDSDNELEELHNIDYNMDFTRLKKQFGLSY